MFREEKSYADVSINAYTLNAEEIFIKFPGLDSISNGGSLLSTYTVYQIEDNVVFD